MIRNVIIVGGGSSGWMTAAAFERMLPDYNVTLIESPNFPVIGVGESTLGHINSFMRLIGIEDKEWMKECDATYKVGIRFTNFHKNDGTYWDYPFVDASDESLPAGLETFWYLRDAYPDKYGHPNAFARLVNGNTLLMEENKLDGEGRWGSFGKDYSYHLDAVKFGQWLKNNVCKNVKHVSADVLDFTESDRGIETLNTSAGDFTADLFIDCTGFKSLLLEEYMCVKHHSYKDILPNNKATICRIPHDGDKSEVKNFTNGFALGNGWAWNIPLWNRSGVGYVWSDLYQDQEGAEKEFREHIEKVYPHYMPSELRTIDIKNGKHEVAWYKNVVGVGLAYGFIEPLESTGLLTTHENIIRLIGTLQNREGIVGSIEKDLFNEAASREMEGFSDFVAWHYAFSLRRDTKYWKHVTEDIDYHRDHTNMPHPEDNPFRDLSVCKYKTYDFPQQFGGDLYVLAGNNYSPLRSIGIKHKTFKYGEPPVEEWDKAVDKSQAEALEYIKGCKSSWQYLSDNIYHVQEETTD